MGQTVKWGMIGLGGIAEDFAMGFPSDQAELVAVASRKLQHAKEFAARYSAPKAYGNYHLLMRDPEVEAVYIATPNHRHGQDILNCLKNGKHVLCEKSITLTTEELKEAIQLAEEKQLWLAEAMTIYHMPLYEQLPDILKSKELGKIRMVQSFFGAAKEYDPENRFYSKELGGGALFDIGVYALAFIRKFLDDSPVSLSSFANLTETGVDQEATIQLRNETGQMAQAMLSFHSDMPRVGWILCENGYVEIPAYSRADQAFITYSDGRKETIESGKRTAALQYELERFSHTILTGKDHTSLSLTQDVTNWMDQLAKEWGMIVEQ